MYPSGVGGAWKMIFSEYVKTLENVQEAQVEFCRYYYLVHIPFEKVPG